MVRSKPEETTYGEDYEMQLHRAACDFVARGDSEEQVMAQVAEHARKDHGTQTIPPEVAAKVKASIHEE